MSIIAFKIHFYLHRKTTQIWASIWWLRHIPPFSGSFKLADSIFSAIFDQMDKEITTRIKQRENVEGSAETDECFVDVFLDQIEQIKEEEAATSDCNGEVPKAQKYFQ
jgi:hypothetical protein